MKDNTATIDTSISFEELEFLAKRILIDFSLLEAAKIKEQIHHISPENACTIGLSVNDFIEYEKNATGKDMFAYLFHIRTIIKRLEELNYLTFVRVEGLPMIGDLYMSLCNIESVDWESVETYANILGIEYLRYKVAPFVVSIVGIDSKNSPHIGSGILINSNTVLTCEHVANGMELEGVYIEDKKYEILSSCYSNHLDIGLIQLNGTISGVDKNIIFGEGNVLENILTIGYPPVPMTRSAYQITQKGEINAEVTDYNNNKHFIFSSVARPGNSGGPIFSEKGFLVGMVTRHLEMKNFDNTIILSDELSYEEQLKDIVDQINNKSKNIVPFYAGLTSKEIVQEIVKLNPSISFQVNLP